MASVIVYSTEKLEELLSGGVVGASITNGQLILQLRDGTTVNAGEVLSDIPQASDTVSGIVELATDAETAAGTDSTRAVTPLGLSSVIAGRQPLNANLTTIAGLSASNDMVLQRKSGAWSARTMAQLATDLAATGEFPDIMLYSGSAYADADTTKIYIGPNDPGSVPNGSIWFDTNGG